MRDTIVEELSKVVSESISQVEKINRKLVYIIIVQAVVTAIISIGIVATVCGFYFLSDYQYPEQSQEIKQISHDGTVNQEINQRIEKGVDK